MQFYLVTDCFPRNALFGLLGHDRTKIYPEHKCDDSNIIDVISIIINVITATEVSSFVVLYSIIMLMEQFIYKVISRSKISRQT